MTKIQWTSKTQNPIKEAAGGNYCIPISSGCKNCYASLLNSRGTRFGGNGRKFGIRPEGHPKMSLNTEMLLAWTRMRKPKKIFIGSMTDVFGEWVPDSMLFDLFDAMRAAPRQTFQLLTKRPERAADVINSWLYRVFGRGQLPANVWLGTSAEDQATYDERSKWLSRCLAKTRFLSLEPLLGPINLGDIKEVDWVIVGGESGPNARPLDLDWLYWILAQCRRTKTPSFVKQLGSHWAKRIGATHSKGGDPEEWPVELRQRNFPDAQFF